MAKPPPALHGRRILVVEDEFLVAQTLCEILEAEGAVVVGPFGWLDQAKAFVEANARAFDVAVLDIDLHGDKSYPVAERLRQQGTPFLFATGYDSPIVADPYRDVPRCGKPVNRAALVAAVRLLGA